MPLVIGDGKVIAGDTPKVVALNVAILGHAFGHHGVALRIAVAEKPSYQAAWRQRQFCLVPMERVYELCWETGKAVRWSIHRQDGEPFTVAAIWDSWTDRATGEIVESFSMLTINADAHPVMGRFHRPGDERRSLVVVPPNAWHKWLSATTGTARDFLTEMPTAEFSAGPVGGEAANANSQATFL